MLDRVWLAELPRMWLVEMLSLILHFRDGHSVFWGGLEQGVVLSSRGYNISDQIYRDKGSNTVKIYCISLIHSFIASTFTCFNVDHKNKLV